jgi:hypothetical protein
MAVVGCQLVKKEGLPPQKKVLDKLSLLMTTDSLMKWKHIIELHYFFRTESFADTMMSTQW